MIKIDTLTNLHEYTRNITQLRVPNTRYNFTNLTNRLCKYGAHNLSWDGYYFYNDSRDKFRLDDLKYWHLYNEGIFSMDLYSSLKQPYSFCELNHAPLPNVTCKTWDISRLLKNRRKENMITEKLQSTKTKIVDSVINYGIDYVKDVVKNTFGVEMEIVFTDEQMKLFIKWIKKYDKNFKSHVERRPKSGICYIKNSDFIIRIDNQTYVRITTGVALTRNLNDYEIIHTTINDNLVKVYVFGKNAYSVAKVIKKISEYEDISNIGQYSVSGNERENVTFSVSYSNLRSRNERSVFLESTTKERIFSHIDKFFQNKKIYESRDLNYKTGILFYGEPGTGKSTLANMICTKYRCNMISIDMSTFSKININNLAESINLENGTSVVLLEDIDCVIGDRENEDDIQEYKKNINTLLQFLDSTSSPTNVIFIATTNHIDKLDKAILRDGRFDLIVELGQIDRKPAHDMCKSFGLSDDKTNELLDKYLEDGNINPAKLQNLILREIDSNLKEDININEGEKRYGIY